MKKTSRQSKKHLSAELSTPQNLKIEKKTQRQIIKKNPILSLLPLISSLQVINMYKHSAPLLNLYINIYIKDVVTAHVFMLIKRNYVINKRDRVDMGPGG